MLYSGENSSSFSQKLSIPSSVFVRTRALCLFPILMAGILSGLNLCRTRACCPNVCEFTWALVLLCLEDTVSLESSTSSDFYNLSASFSTWSPESWGEVLMDISLLGLSVPKSPPLCTLSSCESLYWFPSAAGRPISDDGWARHWPTSTAGFH